MAHWDRGAQSCWHVRASAPQPRALHPSANCSPPGLPLYCISARAPAGPLAGPLPATLLLQAGRCPLLASSWQQPGARPTPLLSLSPPPSGLSPDAPALRPAGHRSALPLRSIWGAEAQALALCLCFLRHLKCSCLSASPGLLLPPGVLTSSVYPSPTHSTEKKAHINQDTDAGPHPSPGMCRQTTSQHVSLCS